MDPSERKRNGVATFLPGRLFQRGNFLNWPAAQKRQMLDELGVTVVLNLWLKVDPDLSPLTHQYGLAYFNWHISPSVLPKDSEVMVEFLGKMLDRGHVLLVHCEAGKGRSVWLSTRLLARQLGIPKARAWEMAKLRVPGHSVHGPLLADLTEEGER